MRPCGSPVSEAVVAAVPTSDCTLLDEVDCVLGEVLESGLKAAKKSSQSFSSSSTSGWWVWKPSEHSPLLWNGA